MSEQLLRVRGLTVRFPRRRARLLGPRPWLTAVDAVDLDVYEKYLEESLNAKETKYFYL